jgi:hypothetical protein
MTARVMAAWMFAVVLAAEFVTMVTMDDAHHQFQQGQLEAFFDAAIVGTISTIAFLLLQGLSAGFTVFSAYADLDQRLPHPSDDSRI